VTFDELARATPPNIRNRAAPVSVTYEGVTDVSKVGPVHVFVASGNDNYLVWVGLKKDGRNVICNCSCPYFMYNLEVAMASRGASVVLHSNGAPPVVRNPGRRCYLCKHLYKVWKDYRDLVLEVPEAEEEVEET
jgi:hypothetical protein